MKVYTAICEIGRGGFGVVEKVSDAHGNLLARKTFAPAYLVPEADLNKLRARFKREVTIQAQLGGEEILPVLDHDLSGENPWFVMPLAEKTYADQIRADKASGTVDIDAIADILNGLDVLHELGFVHRDLNPKNILYVDGHWKLSDLGAVLPPSGVTVTMTEGTVIFTELYCAPEQRHDFHSARSPADVYSFGCILHDIFGNVPRVPYAKHSCPGEIGILVEKCTEKGPARRPTIKKLRGMLLETLVNVGGHWKITDEKSEEWLKKLDTIDSWKEEELDAFARFFEQLDSSERVAGHEHAYVGSLSTPFLTRLPTEALARLAVLNDGVSNAILEKYCAWARNTAFDFHFADSVALRLAAIFDSGDAATKAIAFTSLVVLGESHNRWFVMRTMLSRCSKNPAGSEIARRLGIELVTEGLEWEFARCVKAVNWQVSLLPPELAKFATPT